MKDIEKVLGLPMGALGDSRTGKPDGGDQDLDEVFQYIVDLSENLWQNMSEEHRRRSLACLERVSRAVELERLRLKAKMLGIEVGSGLENAPEVSEADLEKAAEEIRRRMDESDRLLNAPEKGGGS